MAKAAKRYTVLIIPDDRGRTVTLSVSLRLIRSLLALLVLFSLGVAYLVYRSGSIAVRLQLVSHLKEENRRLRRENSDLDELRESVRRLEEMDDYFERLAVQSGVAQGLTQEKAQVKPPPAPDSEVAVQAPRIEERTKYTEQMLQSVPYVRPVQGWVTRTFTPDAPGDARHAGVDFAAARGTPIRATAPGVVEDVAVEEFLGKILTVRHQFGFATRYGHCSQILVAKGEHVRRGQTVAMVGNTGKSTAPHLHYEVLRNGKQVDPMRYMLD